jgi:hypothetical protein
MGKLRFTRIRRLAQGHTGRKTHAVCLLPAGDLPTGLPTSWLPVPHLSWDSVGSVSLVLGISGEHVGAELGAVWETLSPWFLVALKKSDSSLEASQSVNNSKIETKAGRNRSQPMA